MIDDIDDIDLSELSAQFDGVQYDHQDANEEEFEQEQEQEIESDQSDSVDADDSDDDEDDHDDPPDFMSYEDWIKAGKDPDMYRGKKAYKEQYKLIQKNKEMKQLKRELEKLRDAAIEREKVQTERELKSLQKEMQLAKDDGDIDAVLEIKEKIDAVSRQEMEYQQPQVHPVISEFVYQQKILEDAEIKKEFARIYDGKLRADGVGLNDHLSDAAIKGYLSETMSRIKSLYPDRFKANTGSRTGPPIKTTKPAPAKVNYEQKLSQLDFGDGVNKRAALNMYRQIKSSAGQKAADDFAKQYLGN